MFSKLAVYVQDWRNQADHSCPCLFGCDCNVDVQHSAASGLLWSFGVPRGPWRALADRPNALVATTMSCLTVCLGTRRFLRPALHVVGRPRQPLVECSKTIRQFLFGVVCARDPDRFDKGFVKSLSIFGTSRFRTTTSTHHFHPARRNHKNTSK